jgi:hypothetical protein
MNNPDFRVIETEQGIAVTYTCGCPCVPAARPNADGSAGFEHCCCGKVHFVGAGASGALSTYLAERRANRTREPEYLTGATTIQLADRPAEVAWAFPKE